MKKQTRCTKVQHLDVAMLNLPVSVCGSSPGKGVPALLTSAWEPVSAGPLFQRGSDPRALLPSSTIDPIFLYLFT